uniref:Uncharacterized protein n=1 Tax=viral metagenome TaxID=1070528 RepID=A0A6M3LAC3_9ZZZZ
MRLGQEQCYVVDWILKKVWIAIISLPVNIHEIPATGIQKKAGQHNTYAVVMVQPMAVKMKQQ